MGIAPEAVVAPPATTPPLHSLLASSVIVEEPATSRWESGFSFQPENCIEAEAWNPCGVPGEIDRIYLTATGGTWSITVDGQTTSPIAATANAGSVQSILEALSNVAPGDVFVSATADGFLLIWAGAFTGVDLSGDISVTDIDLTGVEPTVSIVTVTLAGEKALKKDYDGSQGGIEYYPFIIEVPYTCSSYGFQAADYERRARRQIKATKVKALEHEFWTGWINPANPSLMNSTPNDDAHVLNPGGAAAPVAVTPSMALILLSQALANCGSGGRGMIHVTPALAQKLSELTGVICGEKLMTTCSRGDIIVNGSGYPGLGPIGQPWPAAGETWAYATGIVNIRMGEEEVYPKEFSEALDRKTNTVTYRGEVVASAVHDLCCTFAVLVDLC